MDVVGEAAAQTFVADESAEAVRSAFEQFLQTFRLPSADDSEAIDESQTPHYVEALQRMSTEGFSTLYIDMNHVFAFERVLGEFIEEEYYRFEPYLRRGLTNVVAVRHRDYLVDAERGARAFWLSFYNVATAHRVRHLTTDKLGRLSRINGTVTRTSDVRPELLFGSFSCVVCGTQQPSIPQQHRYTEPLKCRNAACANASKWTLDMSTSQFVDWQVIYLCKICARKRAFFEKKKKMLCYVRRGFAFKRIQTKFHLAHCLVLSISS